MRKYLFLALALLLAGPAWAGSIRPAACATSAAQDNGLKGFLRKTNTETCKALGLPRTCTDAEAKAINPAVTIWDVSAAGYQTYSGGPYCSQVAADAQTGIIWRNSKNLDDLYAAAAPSVQAQVDALLGIQ